MSQPHDNLVAWKRADDLCVFIRKLVRERVPRDERYELGSQLRRAAYSVPANIVEGYAFESPHVRLRHLRIAVGSLAEVGYGLHLANRLGYLTPAEREEAQSAVAQTAAPLHGLVAHWKREVTSRRRRGG
jgi:four helix bundle protein